MGEKEMISIPNHKSLILNRFDWEVGVKMIKIFS